ncbi:hypothetical protein EMCRGX_G027926 [Ephydatia muelleri]
MHREWLLIVLLSAAGCRNAEAKGSKQLTLAVFMSGVFTNQSEIAGGHTFLTGLDLTLELLNNDSRLLPGYFLNTSIADTRIIQPPTKIMIIEADCSVSSAPIATLAPYWNLVQISAVSTSPQLEDNVTYPTFLRTVASDSNIVMGITSLMLHFGWSRMAVLVQQEAIFTTVLSRLRDTLETLKLKPALEFTFATRENTESIVHSLSSYHLGLTPRNGYLWIYFAWYPSGWWVLPRGYSSLSCSAAEIQDMLQYSIYINYQPYVPTSELNLATDIQGLTRAQFDQMFQHRLTKIHATGTSIQDHVPYVVDAIWAAGLGLNATLGQSVVLENFTYDSDNTSALIYQNTKNLRFRGMTGIVSFDANGGRTGMVRYFQYRSNGMGGISEGHLIGVVPSSGSVFFEDELNGIPTDKEEVYISHALFAVYTVISCLGILITVGILIFNLVFAKKRVVKLSSPYLNVMIIVGAILFYIDIILFGVDGGITSSAIASSLCMARIWVASLAFTLVFSTVFVKTWRVYYIFSNARKQKKTYKKLIKDGFLFALVGCVLLVDVIFLIIVTAVPSARLEISNQEQPQSGSALPQIVQTCSATYSYVWLSILFVYKGALLVVGVFLAWETREVYLKHLNDSKLIGASIYGIVVLSVALAAVGILLQSAVNTSYGVIGALLLLGNTSLLCLIFAPKVYGVWKKDSQESTSTQDETATGTTAQKSKDAATISQLQAEIVALKKQLEVGTSVNVMETATSSL